MMNTAVSVVFYLHTLLCAGYVVYVGQGLGAWFGQRVVHSSPPGSTSESFDDRLMTVVAHGGLLLYLLYAEIYLYPTYSMFVRP
jgi:hypothetical protein